jgi:hypothetical protein
MAWASRIQSAATSACPRGLPIRLPSAPPSVAPAATAANELDNQEERQRANSGVDDRGDDSRAKVDAELRFLVYEGVIDPEDRNLFWSAETAQEISVSCTGTMWGVSLCTPRRETPQLQYCCNTRAVSFRIGECTGA